MRNETSDSTETVWQVASEAEPGDKMIWKGEESDVDNPRPSEVTRVILETDEITIEASGPRGAEVGFWVKKDGSSHVWHGDENMGPVDGVELVNKQVYTRRFSV